MTAEIETESTEKNTVDDAENMATLAKLQGDVRESPEIQKYIKSGGK